MSIFDRLSRNDTAEIRIAPQPNADDPFAAHVSDPSDGAGGAPVADDRDMTGPTDDPRAPGADDIEIPFDGGPDQASGATGDGAPRMSSSQHRSGAARFIVGGDGPAADLTVEDPYPASEEPTPESPLVEPPADEPTPEPPRAEPPVDERTPESPLVEPPADEPTPEPPRAEPPVDERTPESPLVEPRSDEGTSESPRVESSVDVVEGAPQATAVEVALNETAATGDPGQATNGHTPDGSSDEGGGPHLPLPDPTLVAEVIGATGLVPVDRLQEATTLAGTGSLADAISETVGGPEEVARARAKHYGVPYVDLTESRPSGDALETIPFEVLERVVAVPYALEDGKVRVAVADPGDVQALDELRLASKYTVRLAVAVRDEIEVELKRISRATEATERSSLMDVEFRSEEEELEEEEDLSSEDSAPIARLFASVLQQAASDGASDVHLDPTDRGLVVRFRVDGVLHEVQVVPTRLASSLTTLIKVMAKLDIAERRKPQDGRITMTAKSIGRELDVRVAILPTVRGECTVMRLLDTSSEPPTLEMLGFADDVQANFAEIVRRPTGALLVTGPTGSGKSTTLYATLAEIHKPEINVITVEDPVEYRLSGLQQVQINSRAGLTFSASLRSILRADPDVIMVGEIRDVETAKISIESALTGHLVLSTLHTNDAPAAITRLTEMGVEPFLVAAAVSGVIAQRLARLLCTCKVAYSPTEQELEAARVPPDQRHLFQNIYRPGECARCGKTGYKGRVGIYQLMVMSDELTRLASNGASREDIEELAREEGMKTLWEAGLDAITEGKTSFEELRRVLV